MLFANKKVVEPGTLIAKWDPLTLPIISEVDGSIQFNDLSEDVTMKVDVDELTGSAAREVIDVNERPVKGKGMTPSISVVDAKKKILASYSLPSKSILMKNNTNKVAVGEFIARVPVEGTKPKILLVVYLELQIYSKQESQKMVQFMQRPQVFFLMERKLRVERDL